MKKLLLIAFLFSSLLLKAQQPFCPPGAVWHYDWGELSSGGFIRIEYDGDTTIKGIQCKRLQPYEYRFYFPWSSMHTISKLPPQHIYQNGDTVFYYFNNKFFVMFNFGAQPGDTWLVADTITLMHCDTNSYMKADSAGMKTINGMNLRTLNVYPLKYSPYGYGYYDSFSQAEIVERIGPIGNTYLFPPNLNCDTQVVAEFPVYSFRCYQDNTFSLYKIDSLDCEYLLHVGIEERNPLKSLLYPNPAEGSFTIQIPSNGLQSESRLFIYSISGALLYEQTLDAERTEVDPHLPAGVYFVKIISGSNEIFTERLIMK